MKDNFQEISTSTLDIFPSKSKKRTLIFETRLRKYVRIKYDREKYEEKCDTIRISFVFVFAKDSRYVRPVISLEFSRRNIEHYETLASAAKNK